MRDGVYQERGCGGAGMGIDIVVSRVCQEREQVTLRGSWPVVIGERVRRCCQGGCVKRVLGTAGELSVGRWWQKSGLGRAVLPGKSFDSAASWGRRFVPRRSIANPKALR